MVIKKIQIVTALTLCVLSVLTYSSAAVAEKAKIKYPFDKAVISVSSIKVTGKTGDSSDLALHVENSSGKSKLDLILTDNYFSSEVKLTRGKHTITLSEGSAIIDEIEVISADNRSDASYPEEFSPYYLHSRNDLTGECKLCHTADQNKKAALVQQMTCMSGTCHVNFEKGRFQHEPFQKNKCIECHNPHGSENVSFLKYFGSALCFSCHSGAENMSSGADYVHFPVLKGQCTACHDPHKSDLEYHLKRDNIAGLCAGCHGKTYTSHSVMHDPVEAGDCNACHEPHVSQNDNLLLKSGNDLCFNCHEERKDEFANAFIHEPVKKDCSACHDPHGSESREHLRNRKDENSNYVPVKDPVRELCLDCHRKLNPEFTSHIENGKYRHDPVEKTACTSCHTPHSTNNKKLLKSRQSDICYSCHPKKKELITGSLYKHGPIRTDECGQCHMVHGGEHKYLLRTYFSGEYSATFQIENYALCFNCHNPDIVLEKNSESTGFRNGKENLHYFHVVTKGRSCKTCHEVHASDQSFHIRRKIPFNDIFTITLKFIGTPDGGSCTEGCHKMRQYDRTTPVKIQ